MTSVLWPWNQERESEPKDVSWAVGGGGGGRGGVALANWRFKENHCKCKSQFPAL